jgi:hypothetical protein
MKPAYPVCCQVTGPCVCCRVPIPLHWPGKRGHFRNGDWVLAEIGHSTNQTVHSTPAGVHRYYATMSGRIKKIWDLAKIGKDAVTYVLWLVSFVGWSAVMLYLGKITPWANYFGPLGLVLISVVSALLLSVAYLMFAYARNTRAIAKFSEKKAAAGAINVLAPLHQNERINAVEFYHPFYKATENFRFENCEFMGPASVYLDGGNLQNSHMQDCDIVIVRDDRGVHGVTILRNCTYLQCSFYHLTLFMNYQQYQALPAPMRAGLTLISDGRIGNI